jgi:hypothetical protein
LRGTLRRSTRFEISSLLFSVFFSYFGFSCPSFPSHVQIPSVVVVFPVSLSLLLSLLTAFDSLSDFFFFFFSTFRRATRLFRRPLFQWENGRKGIPVPTLHPAFVRPPSRRFSTPPLPFLHQLLHPLDSFLPPLSLFFNLQRHPRNQRRRAAFVVRGGKVEEQPVGNERNREGLKRERRCGGLRERGRRGGGGTKDDGRHGRGLAGGKGGRSRMEREGRGLDGKQKASTTALGGRAKSVEVEGGRVGFQVRKVSRR